MQAEGDTYIGHVTIVLPRIEHCQVEEFADLEVAPDSQLVVCINLAYRHPLMICAHGGELAVCEASPGW